MWKGVSGVILLLAALYYNNDWLLRRVDLPPHLLGHAAIFKREFISEETRVALLDLIKSFKSVPTNAEDLKFYKARHEHIGEAVPFVDRCSHALLIPNINRTHCTFPGRVDIGSHYIRTGGHEGLKETYESLVSRILSFGVYLFDLSKYPVLAALFDSPNFQEGSRAVCPADKQYLDPFQVRQREIIERVLIHTKKTSSTLSSTRPGRRWRTTWTECTFGARRASSFRSGCWP